MSSEDSLLERTFKERDEFDRKARGEIIFAAVGLENEIEQILALHFCEEEKHPLFISLFFMVGQVTFSQKIIMLKKLLKACYPDLLHSVPGLFTRIDKIRELRNKLAHTRMTFPFPLEFRFDGTETDPLPLGTMLQFYKDGEEVTEFISSEAVEETVKKAWAYRDLLFYMNHEIKNRLHGRKNDNYKIVLRNFKQKYPGS